MRTEIRIAPEADIRPDEALFIQAAITTGMSARTTRSAEVSIAIVAATRHDIDAWQQAFGAAEIRPGWYVVTDRDASMHGAHYYGELDAAQAYAEAVTGR